MLADARQANVLQKLKALPEISSMKGCCTRLRIKMNSSLQKIQAC